MEVFFVGEITGGRGFPSRDLFCKWEVVHGEGWVLLEGTKDGQTQVDSPLVCAPVDLSSLIFFVSFLFLCRTVMLACGVIP